MQARTSHFILAASTSLGLSLLFVAGCHHKGEQAAPHSGATADHDHDQDEGVDERHDQNQVSPATETHSAARDITAARCDREARCDNIGPDRDYASAQACEDQVRGQWSNDLNQYECPNGIVQSQLDECLTAIRNEDCSSVLDTVGRWSQCMASQICAD